MISVILPNYNHARFLRQRIDSILEQTYTDFELIILDDKSQDESREIILEYAGKNPRIRYEFNEVNSGSTFRQWQKGLSLAKGEWIWIAESDDYARVTLLERLMNALTASPAAGIAYCQSNFVDHSNNLIGNHLKNLSVLDKTLWTRDFCLPGKELLARHMIIMNVIPNASAVVFRKSLTNMIDWQEVQSYKLSGDRLFWAVLMNQADVCFVADSLNYFRMGDTTVRSKHDTRPEYLFERLRILLTLNSMVKISPEDKIKCVKNFKTHLTKVRKKRGRILGMGMLWKIYRYLYQFDPGNVIKNMKYLLFR
jgi:glycosyltransferase involved in cell wall biosynthesis